MGRGKCQNYTLRVLRVFVRTVDFPFRALYTNVVQMYKEKKQQTLH